MHWNRRQFLLASVLPSVATLPRFAQANPKIVTRWPRPETLRRGLLRPFDPSVPPPQEIFGTGSNQALIIESAKSPMPGESSPPGTYFAAFILLRGMQKSRNGGRALPLLHPGKHEVDEALEFYRGLLSGKAPAVTARGHVKCPWCDRNFGGLELVNAPEFPIQTLCCKKLIALDSLPENVGPLVLVEEIASARWRFLIEWLSGLVALVVQENARVIQPHPFARSVLMEIVKLLPQYLDRQPWISAGTGQRARRADFPLEQPHDSLASDEYPTADEVNRFVAFAMDAPVESVTPSEKIYRVVAGRNENGLLAEAFGAVASDLTAEQSNSLSASLRRQFCLIRHAPQPGGNFPASTVPVSLSMAIGSGDEAYFSHLFRIVQHYLYNHFDDDGMSVEGAFNYSVMLRGFYLPPLRNRLGESVWDELVKRRPILSRFENIGCYPIRTLYGIESQHGDEHLGYFRSANLESLSSPNYSDTVKSVCFPYYGIGCLRAGQPGHRLEAILDFRSGILHTHPSRLSVQLFYEGISLMPELGYAAPSHLIKPEAVPKEIRDRLPLTKMRPWFTNALEMHCAPTIDGFQGNGPHGLLEGWFGKGDLNEPSAGLRFMDVALPSENFADYPGEIRHWSRQWMTVSLPGDTAVAISVCRLSGGRRHDVWWHFPAPPTVPSSPVVDIADNLFDYMKRNVENPPPFARDLGDRDQTFDLVLKKLGEADLPFGEDSQALTNVRAWSGSKGKTALHRWIISPASYIAEFGRDPEPWLQRSIELNMWSAQSGSPARERYIGSRAPWPAMIQLEKYKQAVVCRQDAFDVFNMQRHATGNTRLESTFVDVLAAHDSNKDSSCPVQSVQVFNNDLGGENRYSQGIEIESENNDVCTVITTQNAAVNFRNELRNIELRGRIGKVCPSVHEVILYDGEYLSASGYELRLSPGWNLSLAGLDGDLTGSPDQSAFYVETETPLPVTLVGSRLFVEHAASPSHQSCYEIASVQQAGHGRQRIDLVGNPPFALAVLTILKRRRNWVQVRENQRFAPNRPVSTNRLAYFPSADFTARQSKATASGSGRWATTGIRFDRDLPQNIRPGDSFILYSIQPRDRVRIPSAFACRLIDGNLKIESTGAAELTVPVPVKFGPLPDGIEAIASDRKQTRLKIAPGRFDVSIF
ncbi:hypothetical protein [Thalassoglobus sp.]|uniref:hypothetical protein n=1 Tax=Thalassoglobus sp. TaxID=2795869 RepID=UPI003AA8377D